MRPVAAVIAGVALALAACGEQPLPSPSTSATPSATSIATGPAAEVVRDAFRLTIAVSSATYRVDEPIEVRTVLAYAGPAPSIEVGGSGSGLVGFSLQQLDGPIAVDAAGTSDCAPWTLKRGDNLIPFQKSGGYSADDPQADFFARYLNDPQLRLPAGTWRITALASLARPGCDGGGVNLSAAVDVTVR
jgi:hypothetical protein